ncbi:helix-turn-helix transcriptional regulator [Streptomyces sp. NPDC047097]|uniref:helix-turn-helix domain-containing protein n=1 Tax=Streptomyces sp. NPDC047097 TaxID=3155260 RepID=UPI0034068B3B
MSEGPTGSTVPRRQLGRHLRDLRNRARMTIRTAARALEWSEAKMWRIETGQTSLRSLDVEAMCRVYGAESELTDALMGLAKETKARGWWHAYGEVIPEGFDLYIGLEEAASHLSWYSSELVPGLLQTADYARSLIREANRGFKDNEVEQLMRVRIERQALLTRATARPTVQVALNESVLRRPVGSTPIMAEQLVRLAELNDLDNVSIRVVPFSAGLHHGLLTGPFTMLRFPTTADGRETEPPTVYVDGFTGALYLDKPHEIARYDDALSAIWGVALSVKDTQALLHQATRELKQ